MHASPIRLNPLFPLMCSLLFVQSCGSPAAPRKLLSITISPTAADGRSSAGQVQFTATGQYSAAPFTVSPVQADWGAVTVPRRIALVDQHGLASCVHGAAGKTTIEAWVLPSPAGPVCNVIDSAGRPACDTIWASAQLTCP